MPVPPSVSLGAACLGGWVTGRLHRAGLRAACGAGHGHGAGSQIAWHTSPWRTPARLGAAGEKAPPAPTGLPRPGALRPRSRAAPIGCSAAPSPPPTAGGGRRGPESAAPPPPPPPPSPAPPPPPGAQRAAGSAHRRLPATRQPRRGVPPAPGRRHHAARRTPRQEWGGQAAQAARRRRGRGARRRGRHGALAEPPQPVRLLRGARHLLPVHELLRR